MFVFSKNSKRNMEGVDPRLIATFKLALRISKIDFGVPRFGGLRTADDQLALFSQGRSLCDGFEKLSYHQSGLALDFFPVVRHKASYLDENLTHVACAILQASTQLGYKLEWSGFWRNFSEKCHFEIKGDQL